MDYNAPNAQGGYSPEQFQQWYQGQFGSQAGGDLMNQIGGAVGAPGANGQYSQAQWDQGQQIARQSGANGQQPFFPEFKAPTYESGPAYQAPAAFQAPSMEQALADPGYQFGVQQGVKALEGSAAARGTARTGGALKDIMAFGQQAAQGQYDKVYSRAADEHNRAYQMGRDTWGINDQQRNDRNAWNYKSGTDAHNSLFRGRELQMADLYNRWNTNTNIQAQMALAD